uniref:Uncharacterized protein n=1 Tax=Amazona collaria TaxID=241587 RepID=A0A8B9FPD7_9PSIT
MDGAVAEYIRRTVRKIPRNEIKTMLQKWGFLSEKQLQTINFHQIKDSISWDVFQLCEVILIPDSGMLISVASCRKDLLILVSNSLYIIA